MERRGQRNGPGYVRSLRVRQRFFILVQQDHGNIELYSPSLLASPVYKCPILCQHLTYNSPVRHPIIIHPYNHNPFCISTVSVDSLSSSRALAFGTHR